MRFFPRGYGGDRPSPEQVKRDGWRDQRILVVSADDQRLSWPEREFVNQIGDKLYGNRAAGHHQANSHLSGNGVMRTR
jgi:hypothetical protein